VGGTALAEFYLHHRLSEDIDLFSEDEIELLQIDPFMREAGKKLHATLHMQKKIAIYTYQLSFTNEPTLKVDFATNPFRELERGKMFGKLRIASLWDILINKFYTILNRSVARDFVDFYFAFKEVDTDLPTLIKATEEKYEMNFHEVNMATRLLKVKDLADFPSMLVPFDRKDMEKFFLGLAKSLEDKIFE